VRQTELVSDPERLLVAELHGLAGSRRELRELLDELADGARSEPGCVSFRVLADAQPDELVVISGWSGEDTLRAHYATPHYRRYREQVGPLLARPSDVVVHRVAATLRALDANPPDPGELG
jgi:quinol monooxygenase YgiN